MYHRLIAHIEAIHGCSFFGAWRGPRLRAKSRLLSNGAFPKRIGGSKRLAVTGDMISLYSSAVLHLKAQESRAPAGVSREHGSQKEV